MKKVQLIIFFFILLATSCQRSSSGVDEALSEAAALMEGNHEQAYTILESLDTIALNRRDAARYSLLKSMALDKKYIDLTTDSLIVPAVKYFARHGSADDKLKTAYYHARILENAGESDAALDRLKMSEKIACKALDHLFVARYYLKINSLYANHFEWDKSQEYALKAEAQSRAVNDYRGLASALLTVSKNYRILHQPDSASICLRKIEDIWEKINDYRRGEYYRLLLSYTIEDQPSCVDSVYNECINSGISASDMPYIAFVDFYIHKGDAVQARKALEMVDAQGRMSIDSKEYKYRLFKIDALAGDYKQAYESLIIYYERLEEYMYEALTSDAKIIDERIRLAASEIRRRYQFGLCLFVFILLSSTFSIVVIKLRKRQHEISQALFTAIEEKKHLESLVDGNPFLNEDLKGLVISRINILNDLVLHRLRGGRVPLINAGSVVDKLGKDRDGFILSLAMQFSFSNPNFINHLKERGLSYWEIGFCCLYLLGLSGKEIAGYVLNSSNVYNVSSLIRHKLGLTVHDPNLANYLETLLKQKQ